MSFADALMMFSGIGMLLYGMKMMSGGLEVIAGNSLQVILRKATANRFLAVLIGIVATIVLNSSTASTIMTVGFVNSSLLNLSQAIGIIMGANVGTTFSTQVIALLGGDGFSLRDIAATFIGVGAVMYVFFKNARVKNIGFVILGFGILFLGVTTMSNAVRPLRYHPGFQEFLVSFDNPVFALLAGFIVTAIIQSSTATTAILVTLLATGVYIPFQTTAFILLGVNIGTSLTTVVASIPASRESKRAATFHIMYDIIGSILFGTLILIFPGILIWFTTTWSEPGQQAAMFHTIYNVSTVLILLPFVPVIAKLMQKIVPTKEDERSKTYEKKLLYLETLNVQTPTLAVVNAHLEVCRMGKIAVENFAIAMESFLDGNEDKAKQAMENEKTIDFLYHGISSKLVRINNMAMSSHDAEKISKMFNIISDIERIGDHAENIAEYTMHINAQGLKLSDIATEELKELSDAVAELMKNAISVYENEDNSLIEAVESLEKRVDKLALEFTNNHVDRLKSDVCNPRTGVIFTDLIIDLERSADHAYNIAYSTQPKSEVMEFMEIG